MEWVDVSSYQGKDINWQAVRATGIGGAWVKATEGIDYTSPTFHAQLDGARAAGLVVGAYHFGRPSQGHGADMEVSHFLAVAGDLDLLCLDLEENVAGDWSSWAQRFLADLEQHTGKPPVFYSYAPWIEAHISPRSLMGNYPLWLAAYQATEPGPPSPWSAIALWQYTSGATVSGFSGHVDRSRGDLPPGADMPLSDEDITKIAQKVATQIAGYPHMDNVINLGDLKSILVDGIEARLSAIEAKMGSPTAGTLHVSGDLTVG